MDTKTCKESECEKKTAARGLCSTHYAALRRSGLAGNPKCAFVGCPKYGTTGKLCAGHYDQKIKGKELTPITKHNGEWGDWETNKKGYVQRRRTVNGKREYQLQHRLIIEEELGRDLLRSEEVHHKNGLRSDNRRENLELWSTRQPKGQRPEDKVEFALEILRLYAPEHLLE